MSKKGLHVAVVGATGAVGREMLACLEKSGLPIAQVSALASARSAGSSVTFRGGRLTVRELTQDAFAGVDVALFSAGGPRSREFAPAAVRAGAIVIDNSSVFRMDPGTPLVVPEVNAEAMDSHNGIIANPNCSTIQMVLALKALAQRTALRRVIVSTYQSAAGAGQGGIEELYASTRAALSGGSVAPSIFPRSIAFDCIPQIGSFEASGYSVEEEKMQNETQKILSLPQLAVSATCVRVPVARGHQESVTVDLAERVTAAEARALFAAFPGLELWDGVDGSGYPTAADCVGRPETFIGRVREDNTLPATLHFWCVSDNLLKGAASNAVQIAEALYSRGKIGAA
jgi:aspartate-semialdehyde dehydrogenase